MTSRTSYQVVGVASDAHTQSLRDDVEPRYFVPADSRRSPRTARHS